MDIAIFFFATRCSQADRYVGACFKMKWRSFSWGCDKPTSRLFSRVISRSLGSFHIHTKYRLRNNFWNNTVNHFNIFIHCFIYFHIFYVWNLLWAFTKLLRIYDLLRLFFKPSAFLKINQLIFLLFFFNFKFIEKYCECISKYFSGQKWCFLCDARYKTKIDSQYSILQYFEAY